MANVFNEAFLNKTMNLKAKILKGEDPMIFYQENIKTCSNKFEFKTISLNKMSKNINNMKPTFTTGLDNISTKILIDQQFILTPILTHIFNLTIIKNEYPQTLKNLKVIPILKKTKNLQTLKIIEILIYLMLYLKTLIQNITTKLVNMLMIIISLMKII